MAPLAPLALVGGVAIVCLSSELFAAVVAGLTAGFVALDMVALGRRPDHAPRARSPLTVEIDLSRRR